MGSPAKAVDRRVGAHHQHAARLDRGRDARGDALQQAQDRRLGGVNQHDGQLPRLEDRGQRIWIGGAGGQRHALGRQAGDAPRIQGASARDDDPLQAVRSQQADIEQERREGHRAAQRDDEAGASLSPGEVGDLDGAAE